MADVSLLLIYLAQSSDMRHKVQTLDNICLTLNFYYLLGKDLELSESGSDSD